MDAGLADQVRLAPTITSEQDGRWVAIDELPTLHFPEANARLLELLASRG